MDKGEREMCVSDAPFPKFNVKEFDLTRRLGARVGRLVSVSSQP